MKHLKPLILFIFTCGPLFAHDPDDIWCTYIHTGAAGGKVWCTNLFSEEDEFLLYLKPLAKVNDIDIRIENPDRQSLLLGRVEVENDISYYNAKKTAMRPKDNPEKFKFIKRKIIEASEKMKVQITSSPKNTEPGAFKLMSEDDLFSNPPNSDFDFAIHTLEGMKIYRYQNQLILFWLDEDGHVKFKKIHSKEKAARTTNLMAKITRLYQKAGYDVQVVNHPGYTMKLLGKNKPKANWMKLFTLQNQSVFLNPETSAISIGKIPGFHQKMNIIKATTSILEAEYLNAPTTNLKLNFNTSSDSKEGSGATFYQKSDH